MPVPNEPPPIPQDAPPPPKKGGIPAWVIVLIVAVLGIPCLAGLVTTVAIMIPKMQEQQRRTTCMNNLSQLGQVYLTRAMTDRKAAQSHSGSALWLAMRKESGDIRPGGEKALLCPGDLEAMSPELAAGVTWTDVDLAHAPRALCSYAGRDFARFPIEERGERREPIGACVHHRGMAVVVFEAGDVQFVTREELGLEPDDEMTVGPDSKSPLLRVLRYGDGSVR